MSDARSQKLTSDAWFGNLASDAWCWNVMSGGRFWNAAPDTWFWNIAPDVWFQNVAPNTRQKPARRPSDASQTQLFEIRQQSYNQRLTYIWFSQSENHVVCIGGLVPAWRNNLIVCMGGPVPVWRNNHIVFDSASSISISFTSMKEQPW